jgi:hypothetical protein
MRAISWIGILIVLTIILVGSPAQGQQEWVKTSCPMPRVTRLLPLPVKGVLAADSDVWFLDTSSRFWIQLYTFHTIPANSRLLILDHKGFVTVSDGGAYPAVLSRKQLYDTAWKSFSAPYCPIDGAYEQSGITLQYLSIGPNGEICTGGYGLYSKSYRDMGPYSYECHGTSTDGGMTWDGDGNCGSNFDSNYTVTPGWEVGPDMTYYSIDSTGVEHSTDLGVHWIESSWPGDAIVGISALLSGDVMVATTHGAFLSSDKGMTGIPYSDGLPSSRVNCIVEDRSGVVYIGTDSGLYRSSRTFEAPLRVGNAAIPVAIPRLKLVPIPAHDILNILVEVPTDQCFIQIYDAAGRSIKKFESEQLLAGILEWDVSSLPSGLYFCVLHDTTGIATAKFCIEH